MKNNPGNRIDPSGLQDPYQLQCRALQVQIAEVQHAIDSIPSTSTALRQKHDKLENRYWFLRDIQPKIQYYISGIGRVLNFYQTEYTRLNTQIREAQGEVESIWDQFADVPSVFTTLEDSVQKTQQAYDAFLRNWKQRGTVSLWESEGLASEREGRKRMARLFGALQRAKSYLAHARKSSQQQIEKRDSLLSEQNLTIENLDRQLGATSARIQFLKGKKTIFQNDLDAVNAELVELKEQLRYVESEIQSTGGTERLKKKLSLLRARLAACRRQRFQQNQKCEVNNGRVDPFELVIRLIETKKTQAQSLNEFKDNLAWALLAGPEAAARLVSTPADVVVSGYEIAKNPEQLSQGADALPMLAPIKCIAKAFTCYKMTKKLQGKESLASRSYSKGFINKFVDGTISEDQLTRLREISKHCKNQEGYPLEIITKRNTTGYSQRSHQILLEADDVSIPSGTLAEELQHATDKLAGLYDDRRLTDGIPKLKEHYGEEYYNAVWHAQTFERIADSLESNDQVLTIFLDQSQASDFRRAAEEIWDKLKEAGITP